VTLRVRAACHIFDAKYRFDRSPFTAGADEVETDERESFSFKRGDIDKMHLPRCPAARRFRLGRVSGT